MSKVDQFLYFVIIVIGVGMCLLLQDIRINQDEAKARGATRDIILCQIATSNDLVVPPRCEEVLGEDP